MEYLTAPPGQKWKGEINYLYSIANANCAVPPGPRVCARVSCSNGAGIWLCNDKTVQVNRRCGNIPDYVYSIFSQCKEYVWAGQCPIRGCSYPEPGWWYFRGQQFDTENFNVIVGKASC
ncbi:uncharacterized protein CTRU02_202900 [Colletotrichum truncatum]|uniref:Secreted protein n=1 Tax=Colletotrichum truncatum TaxID=5467 RepID=A0ACC3ZLX1_COLTU|nr:uncharacterized protein CTRU02_12995 [Colletotrichum truncatum]KAF6783979.1 secreted protein [Colletotrichum truncatum]